MRIFYWLHHTGRYERNTGVQRVVRSLAATLAAEGHELVPVRWDAELEAIVAAEDEWLSGLARFGGPQIRPHPNAGQPLHLGWETASLSGEWLLVPEVPHVEGVGAPSLPIVFDYAAYYGLRRAAVFYDLIPLRHPGYEASAPEHEAYARALTAADIVAAISSHSAEDLRRWWAEQGYDHRRLPDVVAVPLPAEIEGVPRVRAGEPSRPIRFTALGTVEPRKNQITLLRAFAELRRRRPDLDIELDVVGGIHADVAHAISSLAHDEPRIHVRGYVDELEARELVMTATATVFISLYEGFGLPIAESLWLGTPCICSDHAPMSEIAEGGGCVTVAARDVEAVGSALERVADDATLRARLVDEARSRPLRTWREYGDEVVDLLRRAPDVHQIVLLHGSRAEPPMPVVEARVERELYWRAESSALLPGTRQRPAAPGVGDGDLHGLPALLDARGNDPDEAAEIVRVARGVGLRVVLEADAATPPAIAAAAELAVFGSAAERDDVLANARRSLPRTVGVTERLVDGGADTKEAIRTRLRGLTSSNTRSTPSRVFYWVGLTVTQPFNTGVQRVARRLGAALQAAGVEVVPVKWDAIAKRLAPLTDEEAAHLAAWSGPVTRHAAIPEDLTNEWLVVPEITIPVEPAGSNPGRLGRSLGMRVAAIFYDLIPAKMPENYPAVAHEYLTEYWTGFADVDVALPISWTVTADLVRWLEDRRLRLPRIVPCVLAGDAGNVPRVTDAPPRESREQPLRLLSVGTLEPRKNYPRLLRALADAQARAGRPVELTIVGRRAGFDELDAEITALVEQTGTTLFGHVTDDELEALHRSASATVFASWEEGFGLPVVESLWQGRPCVCHDGSAMAELLPGGGIVAVDMCDERAIADALVQLADDRELLERLGREAVGRRLRTWDEYADDVIVALAGTGTSPGWPLPMIGRPRPLLTCAITTYNRAPWLRHSLPLLLEATRPWRDVVEVVVCDNASTDDTPAVVARHRGEQSFASFRNVVNVGMLGNLGATARVSRGAFVWLLGDDDLLVEGGLENVLEGLASHPDVEMAYMNYAYTQFDDPAALDDASRIVATATPIADGGANRYVSELRDVAGLNENLFTAIYTCAFRHDHALRAYQLDTRGAPFSSLRTCVPSSVYALAALQERPAWWVGDPAVVVNMNVSWLRWALLWHLERMPDLFEEAERRGVAPEQLDAFRLKHLAEAERWVRMTYFEAEDAIRERFSLARLLERVKHLPEFRERHLSGVRRAYEEAWSAGRVVVDPIPPDELFARYGL